MNCSSGLNKFSRTVRVMDEADLKGVFMSGDVMALVAVEHARPCLCHV